VMKCLNVLEIDKVSFISFEASVLMRVSNTFF
jgi:hypothetical protein